jgi:hypothetical protein
MTRRRSLAAVLTGALLALVPAVASATITDPWTRWVASPDEASIRSLDFVGPQLFGAAEDDGVFVSPATTGPWAQQNNGLATPTDRQTRQVVSNSGNLYVATSAGLFRSTGGTGPWTQIGIGDQPRRLDQGGIQSIVFNSPTDIVVAVSGASPSGIFYSSDGGDHWDKASGMPVSEGVYYITRGLTGSPLPIYAAASDGVFTSLDQGRSWTLTSDGIPPSESPKRIAVDPANPSHLFASTTSGVYRSYSGGATWVPAMGGTLPGGGNKDALLLAPSLGGQFGPGHAVVGTESGAFATVDNGDAWAQMSRDTSTQSNEFAGRIVMSLGLGFSPVSLMAGTRGFGLYWLQLSPVDDPSSFAVFPSTSLKPGSLMTASTTGWGGTLPFFFTYQWKRCTGSGCTPSTNIPGATGPTYVIPQSDAATIVRYRVTVCAINLVSPSAVCKDSDITQNAAVAPVPGTSPKAKLDQTLSPNPHVSYPWGQAFTINVGTWRTEGSAALITPDSYTYEWRRCNGSACSVIPGATGATYTAQIADVGDTLQAYIAATKSSVSSELTLVDQTFTIIEKTPVNTDKPKIIGDAYTGRTLDSTAGAWTAHDPSYSRRWFRCEADGLGCNPISPTQTGGTYAVTAADLGKRLELEVTATQLDPATQNRVTTVYSDATPVITDPPVVAPPPVDPGPAPAPQDNTAPVLGAAKASAKKLTAKKPLGVTVMSSEAGALYVTIQRLLPGRKSHKKCVKPTRKLRHKPRCTRRRAVAQMVKALKAGATSFKIPRTIGKTRLAKGRYRAVMTPVDGAGNKGKALVVSFRVA